MNKSGFVINNLWWVFRQSVVVAYASGLILGNVGILPRVSPALRGILAERGYLPADELMTFFDQGKITESDLLANQIAGVQDLLMTVIVPLAIPLLLFSLDIRRWIKLAKGALFSLLLGIVSLLIVISLGYFLLKNDIPNPWKITGMLVGIYTGGTPNLAAIATALDVDPNIFILTNTYDMVLGAVCLFFLLTGAQWFFNLFLPHFKESHPNLLSEEMERDNSDIDNYSGMLNKRGVAHLLKALALSVLIFVTGGAFSSLVGESAQMAIIILTITTLGILFSLVISINRIEKSFQLGMYFIIVFSLVVSSMGDLYSMFRIEFLYLFLFVTLAVFGSMALHVFLAWIFKVDSDTTIITIAALTFSSPFVPVVAGALRNKEVIISGLTIGILGYALGNYLGIAMAYFLKGY